MNKTIPALLLLAALLGGCCSTCKNSKAAADQVRAEEQTAPSDDVITPADQFEGSVSLPL